MDGQSFYKYTGILIIKTCTDFYFLQQEVRDRQRGDNTMPFFESVGSTSDGEGEGTLGKKKPPPVAPKKYRDSQDDRLGDMVSSVRVWLHGGHWICISLRWTDVTCTEIVHAVCI